MTSDKLFKVVKRMAADGGLLLYNFQPNDPMQAKRFVQLQSSGRHLLSILGSAADCWGTYFRRNDISLETLSSMVGALEGLEMVIANGILLRVENLIMAEAFEDLLEQSEYLMENGYFLAAGVLGRAVLEEHLRKWCGRQNCIPPNPRPTLQHYIDELYRISALDKLTKKHAEWMTAVGNEAAHNSPDLKREPVQQLIQNVREFLVNHPLP